MPTLPGHPLHDMSVPPPGFPGPPPHGVHGPHGIPRPPPPNISGPPAPGPALHPNFDDVTPRPPHFQDPNVHRIHPLNRSPGAATVPFVAHQPRDNAQPMDIDITDSKLRRKSWEAHPVPVADIHVQEVSSTQGEVIQVISGAKIESLAKSGISQTSTRHVPDSSIPEGAEYLAKPSAIPQNVPEHPPLMRIDSDEADIRSETPVQDELPDEASEPAPPNYPAETVHFLPAAMGHTIQTGEYAQAPSSVDSNLVGVTQEYDMSSDVTSTAEPIRSIGKVSFSFKGPRKIKKPWDVESHSPKKLLPIPIQSDPLPQPESLGEACRVPTSLIAPEQPEFTAQSIPLPLVGMPLQQEAVIPSGTEIQQAVLPEPAEREQDCMNVQEIPPPPPKVKPVIGTAPAPASSYIELGRSDSPIGEDVHVLSTKAGPIWKSTRVPENAPKLKELHHSQCADVSRFSESSKGLDHQTPLVFNSTSKVDQQKFGSCSPFLSQQKGEKEISKTQEKKAWNFFGIYRGQIDSHADTLQQQTSSTQQQVMSVFVEKRHNETVTSFTCTPVKPMESYQSVPVSRPIKYHSESPTAVDKPYLEKFRGNWSLSSPSPEPLNTNSNDILNQSGSKTDPLRSPFKVQPSPNYCEAFRREFFHPSLEELSSIASKAFNLDTSRNDTLPPSPSPPAAEVSSDQSTETVRQVQKESGVSSGSNLTNSSNLPRRGFSDNLHDHQHHVSRRFNSSITAQMLPAAPSSSYLGYVKQPSHRARDQQSYLPSSGSIRQIMSPFAVEKSASPQTAKLPKDDILFNPKGHASTCKELHLASQSSGGKENLNCSRVNFPSCNDHDDNSAKSNEGLDGLGEVSEELATLESRPLILDANSLSMEMGITTELVQGAPETPMNRLRSIICSETTAATEIASANVHQFEIPRPQALVPRSARPSDFLVGQKLLDRNERDEAITKLADDRGRLSEAISPTNSNNDKLPRDGGIVFEDVAVLRQLGTGSPSAHIEAKDAPKSDSLLPMVTKLASHRTVLYHSPFQ